MHCSSRHWQSRELSVMPDSGSQQCPTKLVDALQAGAARGEHAVRELHELKRINHSLLSDCKGLAGQLAQVNGRGLSLLPGSVWAAGGQATQRNWCGQMNCRGKIV